MTAFLIVRFITFVALCVLLGKMGYSFGTWQFWAVLGIAMILEIESRIAGINKGRSER